MATSFSTISKLRWRNCALDDPIGIARDLDYYVYYLDDKRQEVLAKYEYAFITAQIIDAHVTQLQKAENSKRRRNVSPYVPYNKKWI